MTIRGKWTHYSAAVPNLGYMYPWGYICLSEGQCSL